MREGWTYKKLGEVCDTCSGGTPAKSHPDYYEGGTIPWLRSGEVSQGLIFKTELFITEKGLKNSSAKIVPIDTVSITMYGATIGEVGIIKAPMCTNQAICNVLPNREIVPAFLRYYLMGHKEKYISMAAGGAQPNISQDLIRRTLLPIIPKSQQEAIVSELDEINSLLALKREQLQKYDKLAQSLFYEMFGDPVENEKGWEVKKLGEVCDVRDGTHDSPQYLHESPYILITSKNIVNGKIDYSNINYISEDDYNSINKRSQVDEGDIIMPMIGTIGNPIIVKLENYKFCIKNVALIKFFSNSSVSNIYIHSLLCNDSYSQYIKSQNKGGTQKFIALGSIRKLAVSLPPLSLQQQFASRIEQIESQKQQVQAAIEKLETLLASRMQYWFE